MADTNPTTSIITLNVNGITTQEKGKNWHTKLKNRIQLYAFFRGDTLYIQGKASRSVVSDSLWPHGLSVQFSRSVVSDSLQPHESQHARPPCPSPTPEVHSDSRPSSRWCHPAISSSVIPFSSCPQPLPASQSFPMSQLFAWGGQSTGVSALASFLAKNTQDWSPLGWTGWTPCSPKDSRVFSNIIVQKHLFFGAQLSL